MSPLEYSRARLRAVLAQIVSLQESEFPYDHSKEALARIQSHNAVAGQIAQNNRVRVTVGTVKQWALKQCEEYFCDFIGLYIFDQAYLHAVAYLLSPTTSGQRSVLYPSIRNRVRKLVEASLKFRETWPAGYTLPAGFEALFENQPEPSDDERHKKFLLTLADSASDFVAPSLMDDAQRILSTAAIPQLSAELKQRTLDAFRFVVPRDGAGSLSTILNAAWDVYHDDAFWAKIPQVKSKEKVLKELVLKNIEVLEIEQLIQAQP